MFWLYHHKSTEIHEIKDLYHVSLYEALYLPNLKVLTQKWIQETKMQ